jgi:sulfotransferase 6B1
MLPPQNMTFEQVIKKPAFFARRRLRRWQAMLRWHSISLVNEPVLFANSFPKSGTHLLTQVMHGCSKIGPAVDCGLPAIVTFDGFTGRRRSQSEILADLKRLLPGDIAYGHVHAFSEAVDWLCRDGVAAYFIMRDPRDVVVSHVHYVAEMAPNHIHHRYYHEVLQTFDERLNASIGGGSRQGLEKAAGKPVLEPLPDIRERFEPFLGWLDHPEVLVLRYEDFLSERRGSILKILEHATRRGFKSVYPIDQAVHILEESIEPQRSPTFRSGKAGSWREAFKDEHRQLFQRIAGDLVARLGYEA